MQKRETHIAVTGLFILYIFTVLFLCLYDFSDSDVDLPTYFLGIPMDKVIHFVMFFQYPVLCWLMLIYNKRTNIFHNHIYSAILITGLTFAALTEAAQGYGTSYREADIMDWIADMVGIVAGSLFVFLLRNQIKKLFNHIFTE